MYLPTLLVKPRIFSSIMWHGVRCVWLQEKGGEKSWPKVQGERRRWREEMVMCEDHRVINGFLFSTRGTGPPLLPEGLAQFRLSSKLCHNQVLCFGLCLFNLLCVLPVKCDMDIINGNPEYLKHLSAWVPCRRQRLLMMRSGGTLCSLGHAE